MKQLEVYELSPSVRAELLGDRREVRLSRDGDLRLVLTRNGWLALLELLQPLAFDAVKAECRAARVEVV